MASILPVSGGRLRLTAGSTRVPMRAPTLAEYGGGGSSPPTEAPVSRMKLVADGPVAAGTVYTFGGSFAPGDVPAGQHPKPTMAGADFAGYQVDQKTTRHQDQSWSRAAFSIVLPAMAAGDSLFVDFEPAAGSPADLASLPGPSGLTEAPLIDAAFSLVVGAKEAATTTYETLSCALNDLLSEAAYVDAAGKKGMRVVRDGPCLRRIEAWGPLLDGTGTAHPELWAVFYADVFSDGSIQTLAKLVCGRNSAAANHDVASMQLERAGVSVWAAPSNFQQEMHSASFCSDDGDPIRWDSAGVALSVAIHHELDKGYLTKARMILPYAYDALTVAPSPPESYLPGSNHACSIWSDLNGVGNHEWVGWLPNETTKTLFLQSPQMLKNDRARSLMFGSFPEVHVLSETNNVPVLNVGSYAGMDAATPDSAWGTNNREGFAATSTPRPSGYSPANTSHNPAAHFFALIHSGDEWHLDLQVILANNAVGQANPGIITTIGSINENTRQHLNHPTSPDGRFHGLMYRGQPRNLAWGMRAIDNAWWVLPDGHRALPYMSDLRTENWLWHDMIVNDTTNGLPEDKRNLGIGYWTAVQHYMLAFCAGILLLTMWRGAGASGRDEASTYARTWYLYNIKKGLFGAADVCKSNLPINAVYKKGSYTSPLPSSWAAVNVLDDPARPWVEGDCSTWGTADSIFAFGSAHTNEMKILAASRLVIALEPEMPDSDPAMVASASSTRDWFEGQPEYPPDYDNEPKWISSDTFPSNDYAPGA